jgi:LCP family protein required for cell wall assembly
MIVVLGLLFICFGVLAVPALFAPGDGDRINLLLVGIDRRSGDGWTFRTDTILVLSVDPDTGAASLMSIPRDLQLAIPGHGQDRINTANVYGYLRDKNDGGPALLQATVESNFGIPIDGYLMVDFQTFVTMVDTLGGIEVEVPKTLHDTRYPDPRPGDPHAFRTIHFDAGPQHMSGKQALAYARSRMSTSDFDRAKRQQIVLLAIRERALSPDAILRWPFLAAAVLEGIKTDLDGSELLALALFAARVDTSQLKQAVLEPPLVFAHRRADGAAVQLPNWDLINPLLVELFDPPSSR